MKIKLSRCAFFAEKCRTLHKQHCPPKLLKNQVLKPYKCAMGVLMLACLDRPSLEKPHDSAPKLNFKNLLGNFFALI